MATVESQGTVIQVGDGGATEVFNAIGEVTGFSGPDGTAAEIPVSNLSSSRVEVIMGLADEGRLTLNINFDPANANGQGRCRTLRSTRKAGTFKILFNDIGSTVWTFDAFVLGFPIEGAVDQVVSGTIQLRITGAIVEA